MEKLVPSFETAKKLSEFGWNAETYFVWAIIDDVALVMAYHDNDVPETTFPAPTAQELLEHMITEYYPNIHDEHEAVMVICDMGKHGINVAYEYATMWHDQPTTAEDFGIDGINLADSLANMYVDNPQSRKNA